MSQMREIRIAPSALNEMEKFAPTDNERSAIFAVLLALKEQKKIPPLGRAAKTDLVTGYKIAFQHPDTYRIDVGRFRIHYRIEDDTIQVGYIGVY